MGTTKLKHLKKKTYNLALIGTGKILNKHFEVIKTFNNFRVVAIHSRTEIKAKKFCAHNHLNPNIYHSKFDDLIKVKNIDAFFICVSVESIDQILNKVLKTKKPFFIEKPPIVDLKSYSKINKYINKHNILNMVGLNRRHYSNLIKIKNSFDKSGGIQSLQIEGNERIWQKKNLKNFRKKNWLILNSIHTLDLIFFFCGNLDKTHIVKTNKNIFSIIGTSKSGVNFSYTTNWNSPGGWNIKIHNDKYYADIDPLEISILKDRKLNSKMINMSSKDKKFKPGFDLQIRNFYKLLREEKHVFPSVGIEHCVGLFNLIKKINEK